MLYLLIFFSSLTLALFATPYVIEKFKRLKIVDNPAERKIHSKAIPSMGGIIIYIITVIIFLSYTSDLYSVRIIILSSIIIIICGVFDDMVGLSWWMKFILQTVATLGIIIYLLPKIKGIELAGFYLPGIWGYLLLLVFMVGVINSINLMDGMDGLVGGFSLLVFLLIFSLAYMYRNDTLMILTAALAGSTLGFLRFNAFPARIFLGDTGSLMLGFFLIVSAIFLTLDINNGILDLTFPIILFGVPVIDTLKVMLLRIFRGRHPFLPDKTHLHHVIFGSNVKHKTTVFIIHSFTLLFLMTAFYYVKTSEKFSIVIFVIISAVLLSVKPLMALLKDSIIHKIYAFERDNMPTFIMSFYRKYYVSISIFFLSILFIFLIPGSTRIGHQVILFFILALLVMLIISVYQNLQSKLFSEIYVLINAAIFFGVTNLSYPLISTLSIDQHVITLVVRISFVSLALLISFFVLTRDRLVKLKGSFLTAIDLIFLLMISLLVIVQSFIKTPQMNFIGANLVLGFVAYLSYKIVSYFNIRFSRLLFYLSFIIPLFSFILIYFT